MSDGRVLAERNGNVGIIRLNRPEKLNAMTTAMLHDFISIANTLERDPDVKAIVVCGEGKSFCAGRDLGEIQEFHGGDDEAVRAGMCPLADVFGALRESQKVTVAVVQGNAMGFGCAVAACTDLTVAEEGAVFAMAEARRGIATFGPLPVLLHVLPYKVLLEMVVTGDGLDAQRAYGIGLVNRIVKPGQGLAATLEWLGSFLVRDAGYVRDTKEAIRIVRNLPDRDAMRYLLDKATLHHIAGSAKQGIAEFVK